MGEVETVYCRTQRVNPAITGEDVATITLGHPGGATSVVDCSYASSQAPDPFPQTLVRVDGAEGSVVVGHDYQATVYRKAEQVSAARVAPVPHDWSTGSVAECILDSVYQIQKHWLECWRSGAEPATSGADNLKTLELVDAAYASAASGAVVSVRG